MAAPSLSVQLGLELEEYTRLKAELINQQREAQQAKKQAEDIVGEFATKAEQLQQEQVAFERYRVYTRNP